MLNRKIILLSSALLIAAFAPAANAAPAHSPATQRGYADQLGPNARALYRDIFATIRAGQWEVASTKLAAMPEGPLHNVARAELYLAKGSPKIDGEILAALAEKARELPQAAALVRIARTRGVEVLPALPSAQNLGWLGSAPRRSSG